MKLIPCSKLFFILFVLEIFSIRDLNSQTWSHPISQGGNYGKVQYSDLYFVNDQEGWIIGDKGQLFKTTNGGISWTLQSLNSDVNLKSIFFTSSQNGWIAGEQGALFSTTNGGTTWSKVVIPGVSGTLTSISFFSATHGWICGYQGTIIATTNGGATWNVQNSGGTGNLHSIHALSQTNVVATGATWDYVVTTDGGNNWTYTEGFAPENHHSIFFSDAANGVLVGDFGKIQYSDDGGIFWNNAISNPLSAVSFLSVTMFQQKAWAVGASGAIVFSNDGGANWIQQNSGTNVTLRSVFAVNDQVLFALGDEGVIVKSINGGTTWSLLTLPTLNSFQSVALGSSTHAWACGSNGSILFSSNSGINWVSQSSGLSELLRKNYFLNNSEGWTVGDQGTIIRTTNGGTSWSTQVSGTSNSLFDVYFVNSQTGWVVGSNRTLLRTTNGGTTWTSINVSIFDPAVSLRAIFFRSTTNGWLVTQGGRLARTTDGGLNWTDVTPISFIQQDLNSIFFESDLNGWVVGNSGVIMRSSDGGLTWSYVSTSITQSLRQIYFTDPMLGWAVGSQGSIFKSLDGGVTWESIISPTSETVNSIGISAPNSVIVTVNGALFSTSQIPITYYSLNGNSPHLFSSWTLLKNGTGGSPINFSSNQRYLVQPNHTMNLQGSDSWNVSGTGLLHILSNATFSYSSSSNLTVPEIFSHGIFEQSSSGLSFQQIRTYSGSTYRVQPSAVITLSNNTIFNNQGSLILRSTVSGTGQIGPLGTGASISGTGTFTIERFIAGGTGRRRFRFFGHPFQNAIALSQLGNDADEIDVTGVGGTTNGFTTTTVTNNPSAFWYQTNNGNPTGTSVGGNTDPGWTPFTAANVSSGANAWNRYQGIRALVRGTRGQGLDGSAYTPGNATIRLSGTFNTGTQTISLLKGAQSGFNLVANPYPATINLRSVFSDASNSSISPLGVYVFNANAGTVGAYEVVTNITTQDYFLPSMGVFLIDVNSAADLTIRESHKSTSSSGVSLFNTDVSAPSISVNLMKDNHGWDRWILQHQSSATNGLELNFIQDVKKLFNEGGNVYSKVLGQSLAVDARSLKEEQSIPLHLSRLPLTDSFQLKLEMGGDDFQQNVFLIDRLRNMRMKVQSGFSYSFLPNESELSQRFVLELKKPASISHSKEFKLSPTLFHSNQSVQFNIELELQEAQLVQAQLLSIDGAIIAQTNFGIGNSFATKWNLNKNLQAGIYIVRLLVGNEQIAQKIIVQ
jgi:photosystem II stability/assembly factor-like uncharacterized protein